MLSMRLSSACRSRSCVLRGLRAGRGLRYDAARIPIEEIGTRQRLSAAPLFVHSFARSLRAPRGQPDASMKPELLPLRTRSARLLALPAVSALFVSLALLPSSASAQTSAEVQETADRLSREIPCVRAQQERLANTLRLLEEAHRQATATSSEAARRDAVHSAAALELRLGVIVGELRACLGQAGSSSRTTASGTTTTTGSQTSGTTTTTTTGSQTSGQADPSRRRVVVQHAQDGSTPHPAELPNAPTQVLARNQTLQPNLRLQVAERVDGVGQANGNDVMRAVRVIAPRIAACYEQLVDRSSLVTGRVFLTFTVTPQRRVTDIRLESFTIYDRAFQRCVGAAAGRPHVREPAVGDSARYSFHLRFGPASTPIPRLNPALQPVPGAPSSPPTGTVMFAGRSIALARQSWIRGRDRPRRPRAPYP